MSQFVDDIDAALKRLVDLRRSIIPNIGISPTAMDELASIQATLSGLVKARDQEEELAKSRSVFDAISDTM
jgi:hypothetical protein